MIIMMIIIMTMIITAQGRQGRAPAAPTSKHINYKTTNM